MDTSGEISKVISDETFKNIATVIVRGMYEENIDTRSLNSVSSPRYTQLMKELRQIVADANDAAPPAGGTDSTSGSDGTTGGDGATRGGTTGSSGSGGTTGTRALPGAGSGTGASAPTKQPPTKKVPTARKKKLRNLDLGQVKAPESYPEALKLLLGELSEIDVQKFPNGTFLMTRAVLEKSIKAFAEAKSVDIKATGNNQNGRVQLGHALKWLLDHVKAHGPTYLVQVIDGVRTGKLVLYINSGDSLNAINHNHHFMVDADQVFSMWASIDSLMRYLMKP